ncbi:MAG: hypothetical protein ACREEW_14450 [Caulobacteraceae bacterium]
MSAGWIVFDGVVPVKPNTSLQQIVALYCEHVLENGDEPLPVESNDWFDEDHEDQISLQLYDDVFTYSANGDLGWTFADNFTRFLEAFAATYAAAGWCSLEGEECDEVFYGAAEELTLEARRTHWLNKARIAINIYNSLAETPLRITR